MSAGDRTITTSTSGSPSPFSPFRHRAFLLLWLATVLSNAGSWMHEVAAGWLMTTLAPAPLWVASVQAATALPIFLFALPAGALADMLDRRRLLLAVQVGLTVLAGMLGLLVWAGLGTPWLLLAFTFAMGVGVALVVPAWQAIVPQLVPRDLLQPAVALNSVGVNISRAVGPALAGVLIVAAGIAAPFLVNAASYLLVAAALLWWGRQTPSPQLPREGLFHAMRAGLRYAHGSDPLRSTLVRALAFALFASAYWALMPLLVRQELGGSAAFYGLLMGCIGTGAVLGALLLPRLRALVGADGLVALGTVGTAGAMTAFATLRQLPMAVLVGFFTGGAWIAVLASLNVSAQLALPNWVRARGLALFVMVLFGAMGTGSLLWGQIGNLVGMRTALLIAAAGAVLVIPLTWRWKLQQGAELDLAPPLKD